MTVPEFHPYPVALSNRTVGRSDVEEAPGGRLVGRACDSCRWAATKKRRFARVLGIFVERFGQMNDLDT